jgi:hypothetical protein
MSTGGRSEGRQAAAVEMVLVGIAAQERDGVADIIELRGPYGLGRIAVVDGGHREARVHEATPFP